MSGDSLKFLLYTSIVFHVWAHGELKSWSGVRSRIFHFLKADLSAGVDQYLL